MALLGLGTVQFGMDYGISNHGGRTSESEAAAILRRAWDAGCRLLDTAAAYGQSEAVLGRIMENEFRIVTKTPPLLALNGAPKIAEAFAEQLSRLRRERVYGLVVHRADDLLGPWGNEIYAQLRGLKEQGLVERIGASVYDSREIDALLDRFALDLLQLPVNVFDQRLVASGQLSRLKDRGVEIHARSALLQGVLLMTPGELPPFLRPLAPTLDRFRTAAHSRDIKPLAAALAFVRDLPEIDAVIIGVNNLAQFEECIAAFDSPRPFDAAPFACTDAWLINPALWPR